MPQLAKRAERERREPQRTSWWVRAMKAVVGSSPDKPAATPRLTLCKVLASGGVPARTETMGAVVVVVDPEPVVCSTVRHILEQEGYSVFAVADPRDAIETIRSHNTALVITNINLPGMSGHDAMSLFKQACPGLPVLMLSGLPDSDIIRKWMAEDGFDAFPKPFSARQFAAKVRRILAGTDSAMRSH